MENKMVLVTVVMVEVLLAKMEPLIPALVGNVMALAEVKIRVELVEKCGMDLIM